jgi:hypothetical protein
VRFAVFAAEGIAGFAVACPAQRVSTLLEWRTGVIDRRVELSSGYGGSVVPLA